MENIRKHKNIKLVTNTKGYLKAIIKPNITSGILFDSWIVRTTVCESMPSRVQKLLKWVVALENQHAIRAVCACALNFGENKHAKWNKWCIYWFIAGNFSLRHTTKCHTYHFSSPRLELFHLAHSMYFVKLEPTRGAYDPMDSWLLRLTSDMSKLSQRQCFRNSNS